MGQSAAAMVPCCIRREGGTSCSFERPTSYIGDDAFFHECDEGDSTHDNLFRKPNVVKKGAVLAHYAKWNCARRSCAAPRQKLPTMPCRATRQDAIRDWLGKSVPEWTGLGAPPKDNGPSWRRGTGTGIRVRAGPDFFKTGLKCETNGSLYECVSLDIVTASCKVEDIFARGLAQPPSDTSASSVSESDRSGGDRLQWKPGCPFPRILLINVQLPERSGPTLYGEHPKDDHGCSVVAVFRIRPETLQMLERPDEAPPHLHLCKSFFAGPCAEPGSDAKDARRSLFKRRDLSVKATKNAGIFKAVALGENPEEVNIPKWMEKYNGKPCLITKSGSVVRDPSGEWVEIGIDVRRFSTLARNMLVNFRSFLPKARVHVAFLIQGVSNEELPEGLLADVHFHYTNLFEHAQRIVDPNSAAGGTSPSSSSSAAGGTADHQQRS